MRYCTMKTNCALTHRVLYFGDKQSEVIVVVLVCNIIYSVVPLLRGHERNPAPGHVTCMRAHMKGIVHRSHSRSGLSAVSTHHRRAITHFFHMHILYVVHIY